MVPQVIRFSIAAALLAGCAQVAADPADRSKSSEGEKLGSNIVCPIPGACIGPGVPVANLAPYTNGTVKVLESRDGGVVWVDAGGVTGIAAISVTNPIGSTGGSSPTLSLNTCDGGESYVMAGGVWACSSVGTGTITSVTGTAPIVSSGGTTPAISISSATTGALGAVKLAQDLGGTALLPNVVGIQGNPVSSGALTAGKFYVENVGGTALAGVPLSQDCTMTGAGVITCTQLQAGAIAATSGGSLQCPAADTSCGLQFSSNASVAGAANALTFSGLTNTAGGGTGGPVTIQAGLDVNVTGTGGTASLVGGSGGLTGGAASVTGGAESNTSGAATGGAASLVGGAATVTVGAGTGGLASLVGGAGSTTGGAAVVSSGAGTTNPGNVRFQIGGTEIARFALPTASESVGEFDVASGNNACIGSSSGIIASGTNVLGLATGTAPSSCAASGCIFASTAGTTIMNHDNSTTQIGESGVVFGAANGTTQLVQTTGTTGTGSSMIVAAQSMSGAGATGGAGFFSAGSATGTTGATLGGSVTLSAGVATATSGAGSGGSVTLQGGSGVNGGAPGNVSVFTGSGGSAAGGNITLSAGGTAANNGYVRFLPNGLESVRFNNGESDFLNGTNVALGATNVSVANGTNVLGIVTGTAPTSCAQNACLYSTSNGLGIIDSSSNAVAINGTAQTWANGSNVVTIGTSGTGTFNLNSGNGTGGASTASAAGSLTFTTGLGGTPSSGTANGGHGGDWSPTTGNGGNGLGASGNGGRGGQMNVNTGNGGNGVGTAGAGGAGGNIALNAGNGGTSTGTANNANGGTVFIDSGAPGTGGSGTTGVAGPIIFQENGTSIMELKASATNAAAAEFGIASGYNLALGGITGAQTNGTNVFGMKAGTALTSCLYDACQSATASNTYAVWLGGGASSYAFQVSAATFAIQSAALTAPATTGITVACSGGTDSLTAAQSQANILQLTACSVGTTATAVKSTLTLSQGNGHLWFVRNGTAAILTFEYSTGTGVAVAAGASALLTSNGSNAIAVMNGT